MERLPGIGHRDLLASGVAAARAQPVGVIIKVETDDPNCVAFATRLRLDGPVNPAMTGYIAAAAFEALKSSTATDNGHCRECLVYVERDHLLGRVLNQFSFSPTCPEVIPCAIGGESAREVIDAILHAAHEWCNGKSVLFDADGHLSDEQHAISVRIDAPKEKSAKAKHAAELGGAIITLLYAGWHLWSMVYGH
jgi:hypothetical protein